MSSPNVVDALTPMHASPLYLTASRHERILCSWPGLNFLLRTIRKQSRLQKAGTVDRLDGCWPTIAAWLQEAEACFHRYIDTLGGHLTSTSESGFPSTTVLTAAADADVVQATSVA